MTKEYLDAFYPENLSMEGWLFLQGKKYAHIPVRAWIISLICSIVMQLSGIALSIMLMEESVSGLVILVLGVVAMCVSIFFISLYFYGLRCLTKAELLYNTRMAGK